MDNHNNEDMNIVIVGHVDHGKSTLIGRLLADTGSLPEGKLEQVRENCRRNSKPFEYAFLLDALKDERSQGITIDTARCFFKTKKRNYIIIDAPGHIEFLKNMISGASRAQAALLVIDAKEGVQENSRRHGYMLSMLGIKQIAVVINKMDLVDYSEEIFNNIKAEYSEFLEKINITPKFFLPVSAFHGENVTGKSECIPWFQDLNILKVLDTFENERKEEEQAFRMPVQDIYKFTKNGDNRRIVAGTIETGSIAIGDKVVFYPSGKKSHIKSIEEFHAQPLTEVKAGKAIGFTLTEQIYITRGELMTIEGQKKPKIASKIQCNVFWLGKKEFQKNTAYFIKIGSDKVKVKLEKVLNVINSSDLCTKMKEYVSKYEVAECILKTDKPIAFDLIEDMAITSRFVIVDEYEIAGGGIVTGALEDEYSNLRERVLIRNYKWEQSVISKDRRAERYCQKAHLLILTGEPNVGKKDLAKVYEKELLDCGRFVYYLGIGSFLYGVNSDMKLSKSNVQEEHIRRFSEGVNLLLDAGMIVIVTARNLTQQDLSIMKTIISDDMDVVWIGEKITTDIAIDLQIKDAYEEENILLLKELLKSKGIIFQV